MRLDRVFLDGFKNLKEVEVSFDKGRLTTVIIGQNGSGKSNLIEAIVDVFRFVDMGRRPPRFKYEIDYHLDGKAIRLSNLSGSPTISADDKVVSRTAFDRAKVSFLPDLVFGYYSGGSRRLEALFDSHQRQYYDQIKINDSLEECKQALADRRLFYCRPIHGSLALLSFFAFPDEQTNKLLKDKLGVTGFHSALAVFRQPWFSNSTKRTRLQDAYELWGAGGPSGRCARAWREASFLPLSLEDKAIDDYRDKGGSEAQLGGFLRDSKALQQFATMYAGDREMFAALEAVDISDLIRNLLVWVTRTNDVSGDVSFADLSDGERQLLMVLGLLRVAREQRALFLLDEPDTHLNPVWQHSYLNLIQEWTGVAGSPSSCQIVMTSHNPLTIAALDKEEVRVMFTDPNGRVTVKEPYTDPRGMGFTATLTEIFGLQTSLDPETQRMIDDRNALARLLQRSENQEKQLISINDQLNRLGFMFEDREPLYQGFLQAWKDFRYADQPPMGPAQLAARHEAMTKLVEELAREKAVQ